MGLLEARQKAAQRKQEAEKIKGALGPLQSERNQKRKELDRSILADMKKPAGALGALKSKRVNGSAAPKGALGALRKKKAGPALGGMAKRRAQANKRDFTRDGIRYHNVRIHSDDKLLWAEIDVSNGDITYLMHNRWGSWMHPIDDNGRFREPAALGIGNQVTVCSNLNARMDIELKARGIKTPAEIRAERLAAEIEERKRLAKLEDAKEKRTAAKKAKKEASDN